MDTSPIENAQVHQSEISILEKQKLFRQSISTPIRNFDAVDEDCEIDQDFDEHVVVDPYEMRQPSRRSDRELGHLLGILDSLETGNDRKVTP
jgi:hypothetical protein